MMPKAPDERAENNPWPEWPRVCKTDYGQEEAIAMFGSDPRIYQTTVKEFLKDKNGKLCGLKTVKLEGKKDEKTGEEIEVEDYDWEAITKAVKSFVEDYNDVVEQAGDSNSKDVLRNAVWLTGITESNENMLSKIGITVGKGNELKLDEEALKKADISALKTLFTGYNSFADKVSMKANSISNAAARYSGTYKSNGTYNNALSELVSSKVDKEV